MPEKQLRGIQLHGGLTSETKLCAAEIRANFIANDELANATYPCVLRGDVHGSWNLAGMLHSQESANQKPLPAFPSVQAYACFNNQHMQKHFLGKE